MDGPGQNGAFRVLFNHIQAADIPMTAPVEMTYRREAKGGDAPKTRPAGGELAPVAMAFLYQSPEVGKAGREGKVNVVNVPAMTVVSVGVRGDYTAARMEETAGKIDAWLARHRAEYLADGPPRYLAYNSPFNLPWMKYGEVQVPVKKVVSKRGE